MMQEEFYTGLISQIATKDKFLEFINGLEPAYKKDYAMIQGAVGSKYAQNSGIRVSISEHKDGKTIRSEHALVPTYVFDEMREVAIKNRMEPVIDDALYKVLTDELRFHKSYYTLVKNLHQSLVAHVKGTLDKATLPAALAKALSNAGKKFALGKAAEDDNDVPVDYTEFDPKYKNVRLKNLNFKYDYTYFQVRHYMPQKNFKVPCEWTTMKIERKTWGVDSTGNRTQNQRPWIFTLSKFKALPLESGSGAISFDRKSVDKSTKVDLIFKATDEEISKVCFSVQHFVNQWERANLTTFISALDEHKQITQNYRNQKNK